MKLSKKSLIQYNIKFIKQNTKKVTNVLTIIKKIKKEIIHLSLSQLEFHATMKLLVKLFFVFQNNRCRKKAKLPGFLAERWFRSKIAKDSAVIFDELLLSLKNCNYQEIKSELKDLKKFF